MSERADIPVMILCGGRGVRLGDVTRTRPKPLVSVGGMPILWHIMKIFAHFGHREFVLCLGYMGSSIRDYFTKGILPGDSKPVRRPAEPDWKIHFADTGERTGTGGRVYRARAYVEAAERFLLTYGDGVADVEIDRLLAFHKQKGRLATVTAVHPPTTFGIIREEDGIAKSFAEKPKLDLIINGGFFVMERGALHALDPDGALEEKPLLGLTERRELAVFRHEGFWQCMDDQKQVEALNAAWRAGDRPWALWEKERATHA